jgi:hypothetical protein
VSKILVSISHPLKYHISTLTSWGILGLFFSMLQGRKHRNMVATIPPIEICFQKYCQKKKAEKRVSFNLISDMLPKIAKSHTFAILRLTVYLGCRLFSIFRTLASSLSLSHHL